VPFDALVVAARWWQLEAYLRRLVYIELRALLGPEWTGPLKAEALKRMSKAQAVAYMGSADDGDPLAHTDVGTLFAVVEQQWEQCGPGIGLPEKVWQGRVDELRSIRHRIAHCRRPHSDDVDRLEQTLRDLEPAANRELRSYTTWLVPSDDLDDPIVDAWQRGNHPVYQRLVPHGQDIKGIDFYLRVSVRPWANRGTGAITGSPGYYWVLMVVLHERHLFVDDYLREYHVVKNLPLIGHVIQTDSRFLYVTFPAVGDPVEISDAIGECFEAVFNAANYGYGDINQVRHPWNREQLDSQVDAQGLLAIVSGLDTDDPLTIFAAQRP